MSWLNAKLEAEERAQAIFDLCAQLRIPRGAVIPTSFYPTPHDFRFLRPEEKVSWEHYVAVARAVRRLVKRGGYRIDFVDCTAAGCLGWLAENNLVNTPENRAAYVAAINR